MRWQLGEGTGRDAVQQGARLASVLGIPAPVGRVLWARGYREAPQAERFLEPRFEHLPNPFELKGIEAALSRRASGSASTATTTSTASPARRCWSRCCASWAATWSSTFRTGWWKGTA